MNYKEFVSHYGLNLNDSQKAAATARGNTLLLAVPGSGKTTAIIARVGYLMKCLNVDAKNILTITYTTSASHDMEQRFGRVFFDIEEMPHFCTINSFCLSVIRLASSKYSLHIPTLMKDNSQAVRKLYTEKTGSYPSDGLVRSLTQGITYVMNMTGCGKSEEELCKSVKIPKLSFYDFYRMYKNYKSENDLMDFDDQLLMAYSLLSGLDDIARYVRQRYLFVNVDEAQDTSYVQHKIIRLINEGNDGLFMVGDEDQSIYGFRAAYPDALLNFDKELNNAHVLLMETNYRSTECITSAANKFIKANKKRRQKEMKPQNKKGSSIKKLQCTSYAEQSDFLARYLREDGGDKTVAVLFRNNDTAVSFIDSFEKYGIEYSTRDSSSLFFTSPTVRDITSILKFSLDPFNGEFLTQFYYKLSLYITKGKFFEALNENKRSGISPFHALIKNEHLERRVREYNRACDCFERISKTTPTEALRIIFDELNYEKWIDKSVSDGYTELPIRQRCAVLFSLARGEISVENYLKKLERIANGELKYRKPGANITLSTVHSAKGLEFDSVIIADALEGIFPSDEVSEDGAEEERRLFYVGCTRAKNELAFLLPNTMNGKKINPSRFVDSFVGAIESSEVPKNTRSAKSKPGKKTGVAKEKSKPKKPALTPQMLGEGILIEHKAFGTGVVTSINGDVMNVKFFNKGEKKLSITTCICSDFIKIVQ